MTKNKVGAVENLVKDYTLELGLDLGRWHDVGFWRLTLQEHAAEPSSPKTLH